MRENFSNCFHCIQRNIVRRNIVSPISNFSYGSLERQNPVRQVYRNMRGDCWEEFAHTIIMTKTALLQARVEDTSNTAHFKPSDAKDITLSLKLKP